VPPRRIWVKPSGAVIAPALPPKLSQRTPTLLDLWLKLEPHLLARLAGGLYLCLLFPLVVAYWLVPGRRAKEWLLLLGSLAFIYRFVEPVAAIMLPLVGLLLYALAGTRPGRLRAGVLTACLAAFYLWTMSGGLLAFLGSLPDTWIPILRRFFLPTGLLVQGGERTFFMVFIPLRCISYLWDLHWGKTTRRGLRPFLSWVLFFPMVPGAPFLWHEAFMQQADKPTLPRLDQVLVGLRRVLTGFALITVSYVLPLFHPMGRLLTPLAYSPGEMWASAYWWLGRFFLTVCGQADFNIGWAALFGYQLPENMDRPLRQSNMLEFWRRWNVMVGQFLKTYVYIPLGGNRKGETRTTLNYLAAMLVCGFWHGVHPAFALWGVLHGGSLAVSRWWHRRLGDQVVARVGVLPAKLAGWALTVSFVALTFTLLYAGSAGRSFSVCLQILLRMLALS